MSAPLSDDRSPPLRLRRSCLGAVAVVGGVLLLLLVVQTATFGRPGLEKTLVELAMPVGVLWSVLGLAAVTLAILLWIARRRSPRGAMPLLVPILWLSVGLWTGVTLAGNRSLAGWVLERTQYAAEAADGDDIVGGRFDAVVILGGGVGVDRLGRPQLTGDGDRIRPPLQLWHAGRVSRIYVTGTSALPGEPGPAEVTEALLVSLGVPGEAVFAVAGRNTSEELAALRSELESLPPPTAGGPLRVGLVTSAFHMPRALRLARAEGLDLVPIAASVRGGGEPIGWARGLVPTADAISEISLCWKEWLAALVGR